MSSSEVKIFVGMEQFAEVLPQWTTLAAASTCALSIFQTPQWCASWVRSKKDVEPVIVTCWQDEEIVMVLPLMRTKRLGVNVLEFLTIPDCEYCAPLFAENVNEGDLFTQAISFLKEKKNYDVMRFRNVPQSAASYASDLSATNRIGDLEYSSVFNFSAFSSYDDYMASRSSSTRKRFRNKLNKAKKLGEFASEIFEIDRAYIEQNFEKFSKWKIEWLHENGLVGSNFEPDQLKAHLIELAELKNSGIKLVAAHIAIDGSPEACHLMLEYKGTSFGYLAFRNLEFNNYSLGELLDLDTVKYGYEIDLKEMDLMGGPSPYKDKMCNEKIVLYDYNYSFTLPGSLYIAYNRLQLRERLKAVFYALPAPYRKAALWAKKNKKTSILAMAAAPIFILLE